MSSGSSSRRLGPTTSIDAATSRRCRRRWRLAGGAIPPPLLQHQSGRRVSNPRNLLLGKQTLYQLSYSRVAVILALAICKPCFIQPNWSAVRRRWQFTHRTSHFAISVMTVAQVFVAIIRDTLATLSAPSR